jgi:FMN phosphatase YigB (HAD superfamily)
VKIRGIILDVDGTLVRLARPIGETYCSILNSYGISSSIDTVTAAVRVVWKEFEDCYLNTAGKHITDHYREETIWIDFIKAVLARAQVRFEPTVASIVIDDIYQAFSRAESRQISPGVERFLTLMNEHDIPVVAATNNDRRTVQVLAELGLSGHLSGIYVCGELGWKKPSPRFFGELEKVLDIPAAELLHVGNDWVLDVEAARASGMQALYFGEAQRVHKADRVGSFDELSARLQSSEMGQLS